MKQLLHLATRIFDTPLLVQPEKFETILSVLGPRIGLTKTDGVVAFDYDDDDDDDNVDDTKASPYSDSGIRVIRIQGTLVKRASGMDARSGLCSYEALRECFSAAFADPSTKGIVMDVDSPGGEVGGLFDLCGYILANKPAACPLLAVSNDSCFSAAYALAACADELWCSNLGGVGSIGCYMLHVDRSKADAENGYKYTYIKAGKKKTEGNPHEPLSDAARSKLQAQVDAIRDTFVEHVAKCRSVSADALYKTEAGIYFGKESMPLLSDKIGTLDECCTYLLGKINQPPAPANFAREMVGNARQSSPLSENFATGGYDEHTFDALCAMETQRKELLTKFPQAVSCVRLQGSASLPDRTDGSPGSSVELFAVPYESLSNDLGGFREIYKKGCFSDGLTGDLRVLFNHDPAFVLGRKSASTVSFYEDDRGVHARADYPVTSWMNDLLVSMRRGDINQSSAAFWILAYHWEYRGTTKIRIVEKALMREASIISFAAYEEATASVQPLPQASEEVPPPAADETELVPVVSEDARVSADETLEIGLLGERIQLLRLR